MREDRASLIEVIRFDKRLKILELGKKEDCSNECFQ